MGVGCAGGACFVAAAQIHAYLTFLSLAYTFLVLKLFEYFQCARNIDGNYYLTAEPSVQCYQYHESYLWCDESLFCLSPRVDGKSSGGILSPRTDERMHIQLGGGWRCLWFGVRFKPMGRSSASQFEPWRLAARRLVLDTRKRVQLGLCSR